MKAAALKTGATSDGLLRDLVALQEDQSQLSRDLFVAMLKILVEEAVQASASHHESRP